MSEFVVFDFGLFILLVGEFLVFNGVKTKNLYEWVVVTTIAIYRIATWIGITLGLHFEELGASQWRYDHKWIGVTLVAATLLLWPKGKYTTQRSIILGIGTGQILDEISEFLMLLGVPLPLSFRDSIVDTGLIVLSTSLLLGIRGVTLRRR